jgi:hypothetical protein
VSDPADRRYRDAGVSDASAATRPHPLGWTQRDVTIAHEAWGHAATMLRFGREFEVVVVGAVGGGFVGRRTHRIVGERPRHTPAHEREFAAHFGGMLHDRLARPSVWLEFVRGIVIDLAGGVAGDPISRSWTAWHTLYGVHDLASARNSQTIHAHRVDFARVLGITIRTVDSQFGPGEAMMNRLAASMTGELEYDECLAIYAAAPRRLNPYREALGWPTPPLPEFHAVGG